MTAEPIEVAFFADTHDEVIAAVIRSMAGATIRVRLLTPYLEVVGS